MQADPLHLYLIEYAASRTILLHFRRDLHDGISTSLLGCTVPGEPEGGPIAVLPASQHT